MLTESYELEVKCAFAGDWLKIGSNSVLSDLENRKSNIDFRRQNQQKPRWADSRIIKVTKTIYK